MGITREKLRVLIREALESDLDPAPEIDQGMSLIESAAMICMKIGDYEVYPDMAEHSQKLAQIHRSLADASLGLEDIKTGLVRVQRTGR